MGTRGRKSAQELATPERAHVEAQHRPSPPVELNGEQCDLWWEIVNSYPAEQFGGGQLTILSDYCKHAITQRRIGQLVEQAAHAEEFDWKHYKDLIEQQRKESAAKATLARAIGIAQRSVYEPKSAKPNKGRAPWQFQG